MAAIAAAFDRDAPGCDPAQQRLATCFEDFCGAAPNADEIAFA